MVNILEIYGIKNMRKKQPIIKYFVSYYFIDDEGNNGFGNCIMNIDDEFDTQSAMQKIKDNDGGLVKVIILYFTKYDKK